MRAGLVFSLCGPLRGWVGIIGIVGTVLSVLLVIVGFMGFVIVVVIVVIVVIIGGSGLYCARLSHLTPGGGGGWGTRGGCRLVFGCPHVCYYCDVLMELCTLRSVYIRVSFLLAFVASGGACGREGDVYLDSRGGRVIAFTFDYLGCVLRCRVQGKLSGI